MNQPAQGLSVIGSPLCEDTEGTVPRLSQFFSTFPKENTCPRLPRLTSAFLFFLCPERAKAPREKPASQTSLEVAFTNTHVPSFWRTRPNV